MTESSPKQIPPFGLRMPDELKARIQKAAQTNHRSMNAEIIARLERSFTELSSMDEHQMAMMKDVSAALTTAAAASVLRAGLDVDMETAIEMVLERKKGLVDLIRDGAVDLGPEPDKVP